MNKLKREFYSRNTIQVSKELLGKYLVHHVNGKKLVGKIVEVEAYLGPEDKAAHSYNRHKSKRNEIMYGPAGFAYVFVIYGHNCCMNVVTEKEDIPQAVLIRALEPIEGIEEMAKLRFDKKLDELDRRTKINLTNGPGKLCQALGISKENNGEDLCSDAFYIEEDQAEKDFEVVSTKRVNIDYAEEYRDCPWRFYIRDNIYISKK